MFAAFEQVCNLFFSVGDKQNQPFQRSFNASLKVDFQGSCVTSDDGLILVRELDERQGLGELIASHLTGSRRGKTTQLPLADLLGQSVYGRIAGYKDVDDAGRLSQKIRRPEIERQQKLDKEVVFRARVAEQ